MTPAPQSAVAGTTPELEIDKGEKLERVYVWDIVVRLTHWITMLTIFILVVTGIYIGRPFYIPSGAADQQFVMGTMKIVHFYTAIVFTLAVLVRVGWMFVGPHYARWHQFVPVGRRRRRDVLAMLKFYTFFSREPPLNVGHNPLAGLTYLVVFALYFLMILTGLALYSVDAGVSYMRFWSFLGPIFGGPQTARWIHHIAMWLILGFFAHHIWSAILV
ncbi:MAG: Ni/Fe-hydrogenase, b-type cytochrome subunit, partial [Polyangiales bacterium]